MQKVFLLPRRIRSVREGNVFTCFVCQSVKLGGSHVNFAHDALGCSIAVYKSIIRVAKAQGKQGI